MVSALLRGDARARAARRMAGRSLRSARDADRRARAAGDRCGAARLRAGVSHRARSDFFFAVAATRSSILPPRGRADVVSRAARARPPWAQADGRAGRRSHRRADRGCRSSRLARADARHGRGDASLPPLPTWRCVSHAQPESHAVRFGDIRALMRCRASRGSTWQVPCTRSGQAAFFAYFVLFARDAIAASLALASLCLAIAHVAVGDRPRSAGACSATGWFAMDGSFASSPPGLGGAHRVSCSC